MAEVKDMTGTTSVTGKYLGDLFSDSLRLRIEHCRIHITLEGDLIAYACTGTTDVGRPIQSHCISTTIGDLL